MAEIVHFPCLREPLTCGVFAGLPTHVWKDGAAIGDRCQCGASTVTPLAFVTLAEDLDRPLIECASAQQPPA